MGDEFDFLDPEGAARPDLVAKLRTISGLADPELMGRLIDGRAGNAIDFKLFGAEKEVRRLRKRVHAKLLKARRLAQDLVQLRTDDREIDTFAIAVGGAIAGENTATRVARLIEALEILAASDIRSELGAGGRPASDEAVQSIVDAVAIYCGRVGIPFTGAPRLEEAAGVKVHIVKTQAAKLTEAVLEVVGVPVSAESVGTHMRMARSAK